MPRILGILVVVSLLLLASVGAATASAATTVVHPSAMDGWTTQTDPTGSVNFVTGPATPPLGVGSAQLKIGNGTLGGDGAAQLRNTQYNGTKLADLTALGYSTYVVTNNGQQAPYIMLNIDTDNNGSADDFLFFEPPYQTPGSGNPSLPDQGAVQLNAWQSWDALHGGWWSADGYGGANPGTGVKSLQDYIAAKPDARIVNAYTGGGGVRLVSGFASPNDSFDGNVDAFTIGVAGSSTTYDFEPDNGPPTSKDQCKNGGWKSFNSPPFKNQGDCVSYVATGGRNAGNG